MDAAATIEPEVHQRILDELGQIEREQQVTVLYACESGSRAWGFASTDSDYDVRFIYVHRTEAYLHVGKRRDVIERPLSDELDISGWDLPKALWLFYKSNPPLLEWLQSPIVYRRHDAIERLRGAIGTFYSPLSCMHHYLHMARGNRREYLQGDEVWVKKYFYVLRPLLACMWIEQRLGPVPTEFGVLVDRLVSDAALRQAIDDLLAAKMAGNELDKGPSIPAIADFIETGLARFESLDLPSSEADRALLDQLFLEILIEVNGAMIGPTN